MNGNSRKKLQMPELAMSMGVGLDPDGVWHCADKDCSWH